MLVYTNLIAAILVFILGALSVRGVKEITTLLVVAFLAIFVLFLVSGFGQGQVVPEILPRFEGLSGVFAATSYTFIMFVGVRATVVAAPETKDPEKNIPKAIFLSMVLLIALYCSVAYVTASVVGEEDFVASTLLNSAAEKTLGLLGGVLIAIGGMVASISSVSTAITVQSSIVYGMSRDGYLPKALMKVHRRFGTPHVTVIVNSFFILLFLIIGAGAVGLGYAASFASILVFALVNLSVIKLRENKPHLERPLKAPLYPITRVESWLNGIDFDNLSSQNGGSLSATCCFGWNQPRHGFLRGIACLSHRKRFQAVYSTFSSSLHLGFCEHSFDFGWCFKHCLRHAQAILIIPSQHLVCEQNAEAQEKGNCG